MLSRLRAYKQRQSGLEKVAKVERRTYDNMKNVEMYAHQCHVRVK